MNSDENKKDIINYEKEYYSLLKKYEKLEKRVNKIITFSDKQSLHNINEIIKYKKFNNRLNLIIKHSDKQSKKLLDEKENIKREKEYDKILSHQAKMSSIIEIVENIAHQWRQPLSVISSIASGMSLKLEIDAYTKEDLFRSYDKITDVTLNLSKTIDNLREFIDNDSNEKSINIRNVFAKVLTFIDSSLEENNIEFHLDIDDFDLLVDESNYMQLFLNILNNSIEALSMIDIQKKTIDVKIKKEKDYLNIKICDNGGGAKKDTLNKMYDLYFTTKHKAQGTGIGLYSVYQIVTNNLLGTIHSKNIILKGNKGLQTLIKIPL